MSSFTIERRNRGESTRVLELVPPFDDVDFLDFRVKLVAMLAPSLVIVLDDSRHARVTTARIIESGGWPTQQAANVAEALEILNSAPDGTRCLAIVTSSLAPEHGPKLTLHPRKPRLLLSCVRPPSCPVVPTMHCADLGCIEKPLDFLNPPIIIARVNAMLSEPCSESKPEYLLIGPAPIAKSASSSLR